MKKMNLNFSRLGTKIVLPLFMLVGLFLLSASAINAQYISSEQAKEVIDAHISKLPPRTASLRAQGHALTPTMVNEEMNSLRHRFGQSIIKKLGEGLNVGEAIEKTYTIAKTRIDGYGTPEMVNYLDTVKAEYVDLLTD